MELTPEQRSVIEHHKGHLLVLAGPGSGKTHTLIEKIFYLFDKDVVPDPYGLLVLTFSNVAVKEVRARLQTRGFRHWERLDVRTFHSFSVYLLECYGGDVGIKENFQILSSEMQSEILEEIRVKYNSAMPLRNLRKLINDLKRQGIYPGYGDEKIGNQEGALRFRQAYSDYQKTLFSNNYLDFADLIYFAVRLIKESELVHKLFTNYYQYILVDEFQDTDNQQLQLVKVLADAALGSTIVADGDQSIYGFRGAERYNVIHIGKLLMSDQILLEANFRSPEVIVEAAQAIINKDKERTVKSAVSVSESDGYLCLNQFRTEEEEASTIVKWIEALARTNQVADLGEIAIITRTRHRADTILHKMDENSLAWFDRGRLEFDDTWDVDIAVSILKLASKVDSSDELYSVMSAFDNSSIAYYLNVDDALDIAITMRDILRELPPHFILPNNAWSILEQTGFVDIVENVGKSSSDVARIKGNLNNFTECIKHEAQKRDLDLYNTLSVLDGIGSVQIMSSHNSKGKEFNYVFFAGLEDDIIPSYFAKNDAEQLAEERRIFYVSLTRARKAAHLTYASNRGTFNGRIKSRFLEDIPVTLFVQSPLDIS